MPLSQNSFEQTYALLETAFSLLDKRQSATNIDLLTHKFEVLLFTNNVLLNT